MSRHFSDWISAYMQYAAHSEAPDQFHFWTAVSCIAGALRRRVWIDQGYFQWTPNFYIIFVAPPGIIQKSTTASIGTRLLKELPDIKFGPDAVTWQALTQSLAGAREDMLLPSGEYLPMSCITIVSSEFGTFLNPHDREMVDVLVSLWDGQLGTWEKMTKTQGSDVIVNPWINVIACTTPSWIAGNFPDYMVGGGFTSRCVFVYGEEKKKLVAYPGNVIPVDFNTLREKLIHDLEQISTLSGEFTLTPEATAWGEQWYREHYEGKNWNLDEARFGGYKARKQTHIHKLAMVLSAAQRDDLIITEENLKQAAAITTDLEPTMPKVFSLIGRSEDARIAEGVYAVVQRHKAIDQELLVRELFHTFSLREITAGIDVALAGGLVKLMQQGGRRILYDTRVLET